MNIAVIFAGGVGVRMHSKDRPKQFLELHQKPIIIHTLEVFEKNANVDAIVISCYEPWLEHMNNLIGKYQIKKVREVVAGGKTAQLSIYNGLLAAKKISNAEDTIVLIHDGVRPLINDNVINSNIESVKKNNSAITTGKVNETIVVVNEFEFIDYVPNRANSRIARAPQSFWLKDILTSHEKALQEGIDNFIDSCTMMHHYGFPMYFIEGPVENIKITTPNDFYTMRALLDSRENAQIYGFDE